MKRQYTIVLAVAVLATAFLMVFKSVATKSNADQNSVDDRAEGVGAEISMLGGRAKQKRSELHLPPLIKDPESCDLKPLDFKTLEYAVKLQYALLDNQEQALLELSKLNPDDWSAWIISMALLEHFTKQEDVFGAIDALEVLRSSKADYFFQNVVSELLSEHSSAEDPEKILSFVTDPSNGDIAIRSSNGVGAQLIAKKKNAPEVMDLILEIESEQIRQPALEGAFVEWASEDIQGFYDYLNDFRPSAELDPGFEALSHSLRSSQSELALEVALNIADPDLRVGVAAQAAWHLSENDPDSFSSWYKRTQEEHIKNEVDKLINSSNLEL